MRVGGRPLRAASARAEPPRRRPRTHADERTGGVRRHPGLAARNGARRKTSATYNELLAGALGASLATLLDTTGLGIVQLDGRGRIVAANDRARDVLRTGKGLFDRVPPRPAKDDAELQAVLATSDCRFLDDSHAGRSTKDAPEWRAAWRCWPKAHRRGDGPRREHGTHVKHMFAKRPIASGGPGALGGGAPESRH